MATQLWLWMASCPWRETSTNFLLSCCQLHYCQWCGSLFHPDLTWSYRHPAQSKNCNKRQIKKYIIFWEIKHTILYKSGKLRKLRVRWKPSYPEHCWNSVLCFILICWLVRKFLSLPSPGQCFLPDWFPEIEGRSRYVMLPRWQNFFKKCHFNSGFRCFNFIDFI